MKILVTDFDGVICNGLDEYFYTSKLTYQAIWGGDIQSLDIFQTSFNLLRPIIETGWEMPLLIKALASAKDPQFISSHWDYIKNELLTTNNITVNNLITMVDHLRQQQIETNLNSWLSLHNFYEGVIHKIHRLLEDKIKVYILTTKDSSFTKTLLEKQGIYLPNHCILGKEVKRPKYESLKLIIQEEQIEANQVTFIEDRLEALKLVYQQLELKDIRLYLAQWGYNTTSDHLQAQNHPQINLLSLTDFQQL